MKKKLQQTAKKRRAHSLKVSQRSRASARTSSSSTLAPILKGMKILMKDNKEISQALKHMDRRMQEFQDRLADLCNPPAGHLIQEDRRGRKNQGEVVKKFRQLNKEAEAFRSLATQRLRAPVGNVKEGISLMLGELEGSINEDQRETLNITKRGVSQLIGMIEVILENSLQENKDMEALYRQIH